MVETSWGLWPVVEEHQLEPDLFGQLPNVLQPDAYDTYLDVTVNDSAHLRTLAVMLHRKPFSKGGICRLDLISLEVQHSALCTRHQNVIS